MSDHRECVREGGMGGTELKREVEEHPLIRQNGQGERMSEWADEVPTLLEKAHED